MRVHTITEEYVEVIIEGTLVKGLIWHWGKVKYATIRHRDYLVSTLR